MGERVSYYDPKLVKPFLDAFTASKVPFPLAQGKGEFLLNLRFLKVNPKFTSLDNMTEEKFGFHLDPMLRLMFRDGQTIAQVAEYLGIDERTVHRTKSILKITTRKRSALKTA